MVAVAAVFSFLVPAIFVMLVVFTVSAKLAAPMRMVAKCQGVTLESRVHELGCELITLIKQGDLVEGLSCTCSRAQTDLFLCGSKSCTTQGLHTKISTVAGGLSI